jgi:hypothetical protein
VCYLLGRVSRSAFPVAVGDVSADAFPGEYISDTLTTPRLSGGVGMLSTSVVKLRLPYSPVAAEIANSSAEVMEQRLARFEADQDSSNPSTLTSLPPTFSQLRNHRLGPLTLLVCATTLALGLDISSVMECVRIMFLIELCVFAHLDHCITNRFAHHPPKIQLNIAHVLLREIEIVGPSNVKDLTIEVGVENPALSAGEGVDRNLPIGG